MNEAKPIAVKPAPPTKAPRGEGTSIAIDLKDYPELLSKIKAHSKQDDREPSKWLRRKIVNLGNKLFEE